ncbi:transposase [Geothrix oryzae]|uniref:transposase n=1 Tax=Geothrix oryzae TaxID=2927975 RepID=UPI0035CC3489
MESTSIRKRRSHEKEWVQRGADHPRAEGARGGDKDSGYLRRLGVSDQAFYRWKAKFGGFEVSDAKRPKHLEIEIAKPPRRLGQRDLDIEALRSLFLKNF